MDEGARVFLTFYQNHDEARALAEKGAECFPLDLSDFRGIDTLAQSLKKKVQRLDVLIHNAAAVRDHTILNMSEEEWDQVLCVNLKAPYYLTKKVMSLLFRGQPGKVLMITSRAAVSGIFGASNYAASKAGLVGLAKSLAKELGRKKILVNVVNPGFMKSRMTEALPEQVVAKNLEASPLGRISDPDEVADFLVYLCSDRVSQVTGQIFHFESRSVP